MPRRIVPLLFMSLALILLAASCAPEDDLGTTANPQPSATPTAKPSDLSGGIVDD